MAAGVATDMTGMVSLRGILLASDFSHEGLSTDDIKGGDTKKLLGIEYTRSFEDFGGNRNGRVDGVRDDTG